MRITKKDLLSIIWICGFFLIALASVPPIQFLFVGTDLCKPIDQRVKDIRVTIRVVDKENQLPVPFALVEMVVINQNAVIVDDKCSREEERLALISDITDLDGRSTLVGPQVIFDNTWDCTKTIVEITDGEGYYEDARVLNLFHYEDPEYKYIRIELIPKNAL